MKYEAHVPTEQYGYISAEIEGTAEEAVDTYRELQRAWSGPPRPQPGLPDKLFNAWLDGYIAGKPGTVDEWSQMNDEQKLIINEVKKSHKRTNKD